MPFIHKELADGRWFEFNIFEQMANIGSEVERAIKWRGKGNVEYAQAAFERALDLIDITVGDPKWRGRLKELLRVREVLCDFFAGGNQYQTTEKFLKEYFYQFNFAANMKR